MQENQRFWRVVAVTLAVVGLLVVATIPVAQADPPPKVLPLDSSPYGNTYGEWSAQWWQWLMSIPKATNPNFDTTGAHCAEGQAGPVWFLAGAFDSGPYTRSCAVPQGKALFFPILNTLFGAGAGDCVPTGTDLCNLHILRVAAAAQLDNPTTLEVTIDDKAVKNLSGQRVQSPVMSITYPEDNVLSFLLGTEVPSGTYTPNISDGYWLLLAPLSAGVHTIHVKGITNSGFTVEVTYHLTVAP